MLSLFYGDREKARAALGAALAKKAKGMRVIRITDANSTDDLAAALQGSGLFAEERILVLENIYGNEDMRARLFAALERGFDGPILMFEEKLLADDRRRLEKYAERAEKFDAPKKERDGSIFGIANALRRGDRKALWVAYMRELAKGSAPEAVHGVLFWAAKDALMKGDDRARALVAALAALPHEARRRREDVEYALERFVLSPK